MKDELTKKAAEMLLQGATLAGEPCPYCSGVRVIKEGVALCISCGRTPDKTAPPPSEQSALQMLEKKLDCLSAELQDETDHQKQQDIIKSIDSLIDAISKLKRQ